MSKIRARSVSVTYEHSEDGMVTHIKVKASYSDWGIICSASKEEHYCKASIESLYPELRANNVKAFIRDIGRTIDFTSAQIRFLETSILMALEAHIDNESNNSG